MEFNLDGKEGDERVENVPTFQYLGRPLDQNYDDWPAVRQKSRALGRSGGGTSTGGDRYQVVGKFLQGDGEGNYIVWFRKVGPSVVNGK